MNEPKLFCPLCGKYQPDAKYLTWSIYQIDCAKCGGSDIQLTKPKTIGPTGKGKSSW